MPRRMRLHRFCKREYVCDTCMNYRTTSLKIYRLHMKYLHGLDDIGEEKTFEERNICHSCSQNLRDCRCYTQR